MKKKICYTKTYSSKCKITAKIDANNFASIFVNDEFQQQVCERNLINNIEGQLDRYVLENGYLDNVAEWESEETIWEVEYSKDGDLPDGAKISWINKRNGETIRTVSWAGRIFEHKGTIDRMDWERFLCEEWKKQYQHIINK